MDEKEQYEFDRQMSQNIATMDEPPYLTAATRARYSREQFDLFRAWPPREK